MRILNYIDGKLQEPVNKKFLDNYQPATGEVYGEIPDSRKEDIDLAVEAAKRAYPIWSSMSPGDRSKHLMNLSHAIEKNLEELAQAESKDNGKPLKLAQTVDIPRARDNFSFFATAILHEENAMHDMGKHAFNYTLRKPLGVVGCISPWNLPLYLFSWKIAPALAAGNCVVAKPSEVTPATAFLLSKLCIEVGFPAGVLNIVHGLGHHAGQAIVEHPDTKAISFTGGTETGKKIAETAAGQFKKTSLELGGKNANIIFEDCDFETAVKTAVKSSFANQGQICLCGSRILIHESIYEKFREAFVEQVKKLRVGPPDAAETQVGALVSLAHLQKVQQYIEVAKREGGNILCGGTEVQLNQPYARGYYLSPTVIDGLAPSCATNQEEIFGPVVTLMPFKNEEEALAIANGTKYGLSATIWTQNLQRAHRVAALLEVGIVWINCWLVRDLRTPFGGSKASGMGREGGRYALEFFTEPKNICVWLNQ
ncbi:MAG: aldehyde dehydrogenase [Flavobacteriales bacterium]|nr:MAG: aldehyde dehydrogenase [Flavobacteriales bacterium]